MQDFLEQLRLEGVRLWLQDGKVRYSPAGSLDAVRLAVLRERRDEVVAVLQGRTPVRTARPDTVPVSHHQQGIWFLEQLDPLGSAYNQTETYRIVGDLDVRALSEAVAEIVRRHEILRTRFPAVDGAGVQIVEPASDAPPLELIDLSGLDPTTRADRVAAMRHAYAEHRFDLSDARSFLVEVVRLTPAEHLLVFRSHHLVIDGPSQTNLFRELRALYAAFRAGRSSPLPDLPLQYADYSVWQHDWLRGDRLERQLDYWRRRLGDAPGSLDLPIDRPRSTVLDRAGDIVEVPISAELAAGLRDLARRDGATPFMVMLAALHALLARWSGQRDISVGLAMDGRSHPDVESGIGHFINTVVLRADLSGGPTFDELLHQVRERLIEASDHRHVPLDRLVAELRPQRALSMQPLFQVLFTYLVADSLDLDGLDVTPVEPDRTTAMFDLMFFASEVDDRLDVGFQYATSLFDRATIQRLAEYFVTLLSGVVASPDTCLDDLPIQSETQQRELLTTWNDTAFPFDPDLCLHELVEAQVARTPDATALVFEGQQLTYRDLNSRANALAQRIRDLGVGPDATVGICLPRSPEVAIAILAVMKAGGGCVPIDLTYPIARRQMLVEDAGLRLLIARSQESIDIECSGLPVLGLDAFGTPMTEGGPPPVADPQNLAWVLYTSGSTGRPKGVAMPHRPLVSNVQWHLALEVGGRGRTLQWAALSFDVFFQEMFTTLAAGDTLVLVTEEVRHDLERLLDVIEAERIERLFMPFVALQAFAELAVRLDRVPASLRAVLTAGEQLQATPAVRAFFGALPKCTLYNEYGPIEAHVATVHELTDPPAEWPALPPIGRPMGNMSVYVLDDGLRPVLPGTAGELFIGGVGLARGYLSHPAMTAERFLPDPFRSGARMYRTGDRARHRSDGLIEFLGRRDDQVKIRGFRVEVGEVESELATHPTVRDCAVVAHEYSPGQKRLVAYALPALDDEAPSPAELRAFLAARLPDFMVPAVFVTLEELPRTPSGKLSRRSLPAPSEADWATGAVYVAPRNDLEAQVAGIWSGVLGVPRVGVRDNFFDLGGHSLLATRVVSRIRQRCGVDVPLREFFAEPTVAGLAHVTAAARAVNEEPIRRRPHTGPVPATYAQQRMWFLDQLNPESRQYTIPIVWRLRGPLDVSALGRALDEIVRRHEALRTRFTPRDGVPFLTVEQHAFCPFAVTDLAGASGTVDQARKLIERFAETGFDLERGPLIRAALIRLAADEHMLAAAIHHIAADGWSLDVMTSELGALYPAYASGGVSPLPDLPVQYSDYAVWQHEILDEDALAEHLDYWRNHLEGAPSAIDMPTDRRRPAMPSHDGDHVDFTVDAETADRLRALGGRFHATSFMSLVSVFGVLLHRLSGQDDVCLGYFVGNRDRLETEGLIGLFVNTLVLRSRCSDGDSFEDVLRRVRETVLVGDRHRDLPFERLVDELRPERDLSHHPVFQVAFSHLAASTSDRQEATLPGVEMEPAESGGQTSKFDLTLFVSDSNPGHALECRFEYATDLFERETVEAFARCFRVLLDEVVAAPGARIADLPLLPESDRTAPARPVDVLVEHRPTTIPALFAEQVARTPDAMAVTGPAGAPTPGAGPLTHLTYQELNARANRLAHHLMAQGAGPEQHVALLLPRTTDLVVAVLAVLKTGAAYVPVEPDHPSDRIARILQDARPVHVVAISGAAPPGFATTVVDEVDLSGYGDDDPEPAPAPDNAAYVIYTSGTTGRPKGVVVPHRNVVRLLESTRDLFRFDASDVWTLFHSYAFDFSVWELWGALLCGGRLVLVPHAVTRSPEAFLELLHAEGVTVLNQTPSAFYQLMAADRGELGSGAPARDLALRCVIFGGEALDLGRLTDWYTRHPDDAPRLVNMYGITETTVHVSHLPLDRSSAATFRGSVIGTGIPDLRVHVLDEGMRPVPPRVAGELYVGGPGVARGYLGRPDLTAERFVPDPYGPPGSRLYRSGDLARLRPDGAIEFLGRVDHQVKIRGHRIELGEIESVLRQCEGVDDAVVVAREYVPDDRRLVAYLTGEPVGHPRERLREVLPGYMLPSAYIRLPRLPMTSNGKVDRSALPAPGTKDLATGTRTAFVAPRTPVEKELAAIWCDALRTERVGIHDNFFALGGHSLLATQVVARMRRHLGRDIALHRFFANPTIAGISWETEERAAGVL
ncbi:amino acid adenylation domain-containing protein [Streptomyces sp. NPDC018026]|uniref:amino acid adenylation domain-containing protein n=1 Tax=Streptomyces sp. NPDC018026 TaxID=3365031 RepID=UPI0037AF7992